MYKNSDKNFDVYCKKVTSPGRVLLWRGYNEGFMTCSSAVKTADTARTTICAERYQTHTLYVARKSKQPAIRHTQLDGLP